MRIWRRLLTALKIRVNQAVKATGRSASALETIDLRGQNRYTHTHSVPQIKRGPHKVPHVTLIRTNNSGFNVGNLLQPTRLTLFTPLSIYWSMSYVFFLKYRQHRILLKQFDSKTTVLRYTLCCTI